MSKDLTTFLLGAMSSYFISDPYCMGNPTLKMKTSSTQNKNAKSVNFFSLHCSDQKAVPVISFHVCSKHSHFHLNFQLTLAYGSELSGDSIESFPSVTVSGAQTQWKHMQWVSLQLSRDSGLSRICDEKEAFSGFKTSGTSAENDWSCENKIFSVVTAVVQLYQDHSCSCI